MEPFIAVYLLGMLAIFPIYRRDRVIGHRLFYCIWLSSLWGLLVPVALIIAVIHVIGQSREEFNH